MQHIYPIELGYRGLQASTGAERDHTNHSDLAHEHKVQLQDLFKMQHNDAFGLSSACRGTIFLHHKGSLWSCPPI